MKENKYIEILRKLPPKDYTKFGSFLASGYHNKNKNITRLFNLLKHSHREIEAGEFPKEKIIKNIFGRTKQASQKANMLLSEFKNLLHIFLLNEYLEKNDIEKNYLLLKIFKESDAVRNYTDSLNRIKHTNQTEKLSSYDRYYYSFITEYQDKISRLNDIIYSENDALQQLSANMDLFFICYKLQVYIAMIRHNKETLFNTEYTPAFKDEIIEYIRQKEDLIRKEHPLIYSQYLLLMMLEETGGEYYLNKCRKYIIQNQNRLENNVLKDILMDYKNNCDDRIHIDQQKFTKEIFDVYKLLDEKNIYVKNNFIEHIDFMNATLSAIALNNIAWAEYFYEKYKEKINPVYRDDTKHLIKANIFFRKKKYTDALTELNMISSKRFYFFLRIRMLRIKTYFELNETEAVGYIIDSVKHYIKRNKNILGGNFEIVNNFLNLTAKIMKAKSANNWAEAERLKNSLTTLHSISFKAWLTEKLNEIQNQKLSSNKAT